MSYTSFETFYFSCNHFLQQSEKTPYRPAFLITLTVKFAVNYHTWIEKHFFNLLHDYSFLSNQSSLGFVYQLFNQAINISLSKVSLISFHYNLRHFIPKDKNLTCHTFVYSCEGYTYHI